MGAAKILREVYRQHVDHFGEPDDSLVLDDGKPMRGFPKRVKVLVWHPDDQCDMTSFATIGMAEEPMEGAGHRAELHLSLRGRHATGEVRSLCLFLANLAMYPFHNKTFLDWWHTLTSPGPIPLFRKAQCVLLRPRFVQEGWDRFEANGIEVRILNVVPITAEEHDLKEIRAILDRLAEVDIFSPR